MPPKRPRLAAGDFAQYVRLLMGLAALISRVPILPPGTSRDGSRRAVWHQISGSALLTNYPAHRQHSFLWDRPNQAHAV